MAAVYTIAAIDANTAEIFTSTKKWKVQVGAVTYADLDTGVVTVSFGDVTMPLTADDIISVGGNAPDSDPSTLCAQISACFPAMGTVTITPNVTINNDAPVVISGGLPINLQATVMDTTAPLDASGSTLSQDNPMCRGGIITITTQGKTGSPSAIFSLQQYNGATTEWETLGALTGAVTTNTKSIRVVYPGVVDASFGVLPKTWRVSWEITGVGTFDANINVNYVV